MMMERKQVPPTYLNYRNESIGNGSSTTNSSNNNLPQPPVSPSRPPPYPPPPAAVQSHTNTLLVFIADAPAPDMAVYLSTILSRYSIAEVSIIATNDEALKVTRMHVYTAAGKMRQDILVSTTRLNTPVAAAEVVKATKGLDMKTLSGVLCCQHSSVAQQVEPDAPTSPRDILDYDEVELEDSWRTNLLTLHTLARATMPSLRKAPLHPSPFFCLDSSLALSPLDISGQETLLQMLASSPASQGIRFGTAKEELIPAVVTPSERSLAIDIPSGHSNNGGGGVGNGNGNGNGGAYFGADQFGMGSPLPDSLPESPTKMWAAWAMMNE